MAYPGGVGRCTAHAAECPDQPITLTALVSSPTLEEICVRPGCARRRAGGKRLCSLHQASERAWIDNHKDATPMPAEEPVIKAPPAPCPVHPDRAGGKRGLCDTCMSSVFHDVRRWRKKGFVTRNDTKAAAALRAVGLEGEPWWAPFVLSLRAELRKQERREAHRRASTAEPEEEIDVRQQEKAPAVPIQPPDTAPLRLKRAQMVLTAADAMDQPDKVIIYRAIGEVLRSIADSLELPPGEE